MTRFAPAILLAILAGLGLGLITSNAIARAAYDAVNMEELLQ